MKIRVAKEKIEADLEQHEVLLFHNVLNEVCNGFMLPDFESRIGAHEQLALELFGRFQLFEVDHPARIQLSGHELIILENALRETLCELGVEKFSIRTGLPFEFGQTALREIRNRSSD